MDVEKHWLNWRHLDFWWSTFHSGRTCQQAEHAFCGTSKPDFYAERPLHCQKVTVWAALSSTGIIGPFFLWRGWWNHNSYVATLSDHSKDKFFSWAKEKTYRNEQRMVSAGWRHPTHCKNCTWMAGWKVWRTFYILTFKHWMATTFTWSQPFRFLFMGLFKGPCLFTFPTRHECSANVYTKRNPTYNRRLL